MHLQTASVPCFPLLILRRPWREREAFNTNTKRLHSNVTIVECFPAQSSLFIPSHRHDLVLHIEGISRVWVLAQPTSFCFLSTASHLWHGEHVCRVFHYIESVARPQCKWAPAWSIMLIVSETLITVISRLEPWQLVSARFPGSLWFQFNNRPLLASSCLHCAGV